MAKEPIYRRFHQGDITFSLIYAFHEHFILVLCARRSGARQGLAARQDAGRRLAEVRESADVLRVDVRASRQEAALHGRGIRPVARVESRPEPRLAPERLARARRPAAGSSSISTGSTRTSRRSTIRTTPTKASSGSISTTATTPWSPSCARAATGDIIVFVVNATPVVREAYRVGVPRRGLVRGDPQYRRADLRRSEYRAITAARIREPIPWQGSPYSLLLRLPPLGVVGLKWRAPEKSAEVLED